MINSIGSAWRSHLETGFPPTDRVYADFRLIEYPDLETGSAAYTLAREDNLIDRGNCESTTAPMLLDETAPSLGNCTFARSSDYAHGGDYAYKCTKTAAAGNWSYCRQVDNTNTDDMHGFVAGETYEISYRLYIPTASGITGSEIKLRVIEYDTVPAAATTTIATAANTYDEWQELSGTITLSSDTNGVILYLEVNQTAANNEYFYVDDIRLITHIVPGSHYLSSGYIETLCPMTETFTLQINFKPNFAYTSAAQKLCGWYVDSTHYLGVYYYGAADRFDVIWRDGGTNRSLNSAQYDDGTTYRNINQYITLTAAIDLSTGTTAGSSLWLDKTQDDTAWSGAIDAKSTEFNLMQIRAYDGTAGAFDIAYVRLWPNRILTDAEVQNDAKDVTDEEIFWSLDGHGTGRTRCNITRFVRSISTTKSVENPANGAQGANRVSFSLNNTAGEFSDDQYAAFDPTSDQFNGTVAQKYLQRRSNITIENWYAGDFDTIFFGKLTSNRYKRQTASDKFGTVSCNAEDYVGLIARKSVRRGRYWENADLVDTATESDSLLHLITRLATKKEVYNYLADSSFESTAISDSWDTSSTDVALAQSTAYAFFGSKSGKITFTAPGQILQTITFTGKKKLNVGETWTWYGWVLSTGAASDTDNRLYLSEASSSGAIGETGQEYTLSGGENWKKVEVSHTITSSEADRLVANVSGSTGDIIYFDDGHLIQNERALNYRVPNDNMGSSAIESADDADSDSYDTIGFDVQDVAITHPWRRVEANESLWEHVQDLGNATVASYIGLNSAGTLRYRSRLSSDYSDPVPMGTLQETQGASIGLEQSDANRLVIHGVHIGKAGYTGIVWDAGASRTFASSTDPVGINESVSTGATWPSTSTYGNEFIARYGESGEMQEPIEPEERDYSYYKGPDYFEGPYQAPANAIEGFWNWVTNIFKA